MQWYFKALAGTDEGISSMHSADVMDVEKLDKQVQSLQRQLEAAQRMSALGELVSTTTHEFNNVLMAIINYAKLGLRHKDEATRDKSLQKILAAGERAARITNTVLALARNRSARMEPTDLASLIDDTLLVLDREMNKYRIRVDRDFQPVPAVLANGSQLQQVLLNLLINARQAMPNGGRIVIRVAHDRESEMVDLVVRDSGCGIPQDQLRQIFEPFFTTKSGPDDSGKGGSGLGLATCRKIVEAHQGRIIVQSTVGKGTAFTIKLPIALSAMAANPVAQSGQDLPAQRP
jgi:signal transduction histidine kinase